MFVAVHEKYERIKREIERKGMIATGKIVGYESLTTNSHGARSARWFTRHEKYFATGYSSLCLTVAIFHPEVGISASHRDPVTSEDSVRAIIEVTSIPELALAYINGQRELNVADFVSKEAIEDTTERTVGESIADFTALRKRGNLLPSEDVTVFIHGFSIFDQTVLDSTLDTVQKRILSDELLKSSGVNSIQFESNLGLEGEIRYGGPMHPLYQTPKFYGPKSF